MIATQQQVIGFGRKCLELCNNGELHFHAPLSLLLGNFLVLPEEIGTTSEELKALTERVKVFKRSQEIERLKGLLDNCRNGRVCVSDVTELSQLRSELVKGSSEADLLTEIGTTPQEIARFRRAARIAETYLGRFLMESKQYFKEYCLVHVADDYFASFEDMLSYLNSFAIDPSEIGTSLDELRTAWNEGQLKRNDGKLKLATDTWGAWGKPRFSAKGFLREMRRVLDAGILPNQFGTTQEEVAARLRSAAVTCATELARKVHGGELYDVGLLREYCETYAITPDELGFEGTFAALEAKGQQAHTEHLEYHEKQNLKRDCLRYNLPYSDELTSQERAALRRQVYALITRLRAGGEFVERDIDDDGSDASRLSAVGDTLYARVNLHLTHEEVGITREDFVTQTIAALVERARYELRTVLEHETGLPFTEYDPDPAHVACRIRGLVEARIASYEDLDAPPAVLEVLEKLDKFVQQSLQSPVDFLDADDA